MKNFFSSALFFGIASLIEEKKLMSIYRPTCCLGLSGIIFAAPVAAQIVPDATLRVNSIVTPNGNTFTIEGGSRLGGNLFHSFREFSLTTGREAFFNNAVDVQNIFTRVTGSNISNIDGLIRANGGANLFLLNPNGIVFGNNARLNIGGSFFGSTASSVRFADGSTFSTADTSTPPLLTVSVPIGLQMGQKSGAIQVQGRGHNLSWPSTTTRLQGNFSGGLQVKPNQTLALVGSQVTLNGGILTADSGRIEIGGVTTGQVTLAPTANGWTLSYPQVQTFGDIQLAKASLVNASGNGGSGIQLAGRQITISDGSLAFVRNQGSLPGGAISLQASELIDLRGSVNSRTGVSSGARTETVAAGTGGDITVATGSLIHSDGARIETFAFGTGRGGNIAVNVTDSVRLLRANPLNSLYTSGIRSSNVGAGAAGDITVSTNRLSIVDGGGLASATFGSGNGGNVTARVADSIEVTGFNRTSGGATPPRSILVTSSLGAGNGGNLTIDTARAIVRDGARIGASTEASGRGGNLLLNAAQSVEVSGIGTGTQLQSLVASGAEANLAVQRILGLPPIPSGNSGTLTVNTPRLIVSDGARVGVDNQGTGNAGSMSINARQIFVSRHGRIAASTASGEGGNISLRSQFLLLRDNSQITATASGTGNGGNITIDSPIIVGLQNSDIVANAFQGNGGNIQINTQGIFGLENRPQLTPFSDISASSQFGVSGTVNISVLNVNQQNVVAPPPSNFVSTDRIMANSCLARSGNSQGSFTIAGNGGLPETPETATIPYQVVQVGSVQPQPVSSSLERSQPPTPSWQFGDPIVEATEFTVNAQGQVVLTAKGNSGTGAIAHPHPIPCEPNLFQ
ncbi:MAG TPA: filamentous hemagglutinin [Cyanobacteria bacterium UBA11372]|nr:filamentous hemagglutinin [Cyanobacteria bacterium UBA11372]